MRTIILGIVFLTGCASSYASKCVEWMPKSSHYELKIGSVDRVDIWRCTSFSEVP